MHFSLFLWPRILCWFLSLSKPREVRLRSFEIANWNQLKRRLSRLDLSSA
jgi:hypothetical protein